MSRQLLQRIDELKLRMATLREGPSNSVALIGITALEQELGRVARQLPPEWSLASASTKVPQSTDDGSLQPAEAGEVTLTERAEALVELGH